MLKAAVTAAALIGTAGHAAAAETVVWWDFLGGGDGVRMKALIADFNKEHPDIQIEATTLEWGVPFYTKVRTSAGVGEGPDVMTYHLSRIPIALDEGVLSPITDEDLANAGPDEGGLLPALDRGGELGRPAVRRSVRYPRRHPLLQQGPAEGDALPRRRRQADRHQQPRRLHQAALKALKDKGVEVPLSLATADDGRHVLAHLLHAARAAGRPVHRRQRGAARRQRRQGGQGDPDH